MSKKSRLITFILLLAALNIVLIGTGLHLVTQNDDEGVLPTQMELPSLTPSEQALTVVDNQVAPGIVSVADNPMSVNTVPPTPTPTASATATSTPVPASNTPSSSPVPVATALSIPTVEPVVIPVLPEPVPNQVVIRFTPQTTEAQRAAYIQSIGGTVSQTIGALDTVVVSVPPEVASRPLAQSAVVANSEPDYFAVALDAVPVSDPLYAQQWSLPVINVPAAWDAFPADAPIVTVAVVDSGICADHPDLKGRIAAGWDFVEDDAVPQDELGHGCGVAGIIAANTNDAIGIAGIAPNAQILPLRVLNAQGVGTYSDVAAALIFAADNGAQIINLSLGGSNASTVLEDAINYAVAKGVSVIAAAGNTGGSVLYPAAYELVIAVASVDPNLERSSFSSYGPEVDILAPGRDILTTKLDGTYTTMSGTSFAAPTVAGVAAVELAFRRELVLDGGIVSVGRTQEVVVTPTATATVTQTLIPAPTKSFDLTQIVFPTSLIEFGPSTDRFSSSAYLSSTQSGLVNVLTESTSVPEVIDSVALKYGINPRILIALIESQTQMVSSRLTPSAITLENPLGLPDAIAYSLSGFEIQMDWAANFLRTELVLREHDENYTTIRFPDGTTTSVGFEVPSGNFVILSITASIGYPDQWHERYITFLEKYDSFLATSAMWGITAQATLPSVKLPFEGTKRYTGGPHAGSGGSCTSVSLDASGIDFAAQTAGNSFQVLNIADGTLKNVAYIDSTAAYDFGWTVSVELNNSSGLAVLYAHLNLSTDDVNRLLALKNKPISQGYIIGNSGQSGGQSNVHLHLELRTGGTTYDSYATIGSRFGWEGNQIDGWSIHIHRIGQNGSTGYNYQGSAVRGSSKWVLLDAYCGSGSTSWANVGVNYNRTDEANGVDSNTIFADIGSSSTITSSNTPNNNPPSSCSNTPSSVRLFDATNCGGNASSSQTSPGWYDYGGSFNDRAKSIEIPQGWSVKLYLDNTENSPSVCIPDTDSDLTNNTFSDGTPVARANPSAGQSPGETTSIRVYNNDTCSGGGGGTITGTWHARYDDGDTRWWNTDPSYTPRCEEDLGGPSLDKNYGTSGPCGMDGDTWIGDYTATLNFPTGNYVIRVEHDDGLKMWIGSQNISERSSSGWTYLCPARTLSGSTNLRVILREDGGDAKVKVTFESDSGQCSAPAAPSNLSASPASQTQINLSWSDNSGDESGFKIERSPDNTNWSEIATVGSNQTSYQNNSGLVCGTTYYYRVRSYKDSNGQNSSPSNTASARISCPLSAPSNLTASPASQTQINLAWSDNSGDESGFKIERSPDNTNWSEIATVGSNQTSYQNNSGLVCGPPYYYRVRAYRSSDGQNSSYSNTASTSITCVVNPPSAPVLISPANGTIVNRFADVNLSWNASSGATEYFAEFMGGPAIYLTSEWTSNTSWFVGSQWAGGYIWRVKARNSAGESGWSEFWRLDIKYGSPSNLTATAVSGSQINLSWNTSADAPGNIDGYRIYRNGSSVGTVGSSATTFSDNGLNCGSSYSYTVKAYKATTESDASNTASATTAVCSGSGTGLTGEYYNNTNFTELAIARVDPTIDFNWDQGSPHGSIEPDTFSARWTGQIQPLYSQTYTFYVNTDDGVRLWVNGQLLIDKWLDQVAEWSGSIALTGGQKYDIKLEYYENGGGALIRLEWASGSQGRQVVPQSQLYPYIEPPSTLSAAAVSASQINLSWSDNSDNETGFRVERSLNGTTSWNEIAQLTANTTSYQSTGLSANTTYHYRVRAYRSTGSQYSAFSNVSSATTLMTNANPPILSNPLDNALLPFRTVDFQWQSSNSPNQTGYGFRLSQSSNPQTAPWIVNTTLGNSTLIYTHNFAADGTYYWHVQTLSPTGNSSWVTRRVTIDSTPPEVAFTFPTADSFINANIITIQATASDSTSGISGLQFYVGFDADLSAASVGSLSESERPTPTPDSIPGNVMNLGDVGAQGWDWHPICWDDNASDGWSCTWDATNAADQYIAFFIYAYDNVGYYQSAVNWTVALDRTAPSSSVSTLPAESQLTFAVNWSGTDNLSEIANYDIQYQDNGGSWVNWQTNVTLTSASFTGVRGHTYAFRSRAEDHAGNVEDWPAIPDTQTIIPLQAEPPVLTNPPDGAILNSRTVSFRWQNPNAPGQTGYTLRISQSANPESAPFLVNATLARTSTLYNYTFGADGIYFWHMRTNTSTGSSAWVTQSLTIDTTPPTGSVTSPPANSYLRGDAITITGLANDGGSGVQCGQFFVGYDPGLGSQDLADVSQINPPQPAPSSESISAPNQTSDVIIQSWGWEEIGWDCDGSDGWIMSRDASTIADQNIAVWIYFYDFAWNYVGVSNGEILLDRTSPLSSIAPLPATTTTTFSVTWSGSDNLSGISGYDVQYQINGGVWTDWYTEVSFTSATFMGENGNTYGFRSRARDNAGNLESWPATPDTVTTVSAAPPFNDEFVNTENITTLSFSLTEEISSATVASNDPQTCVYDRGYTVWFRYTPPANQNLNFNTNNSEYDTVLAVYTGNEGNLVMIGCDDDSGVGLASSLTFNAQAGVTYHIMIAKYGIYPLSSAAMLTFSAQTTTPPTRPILVSPVVNALTNDNTPALTWDAATNASRYEVQIDDTSNFSSLVQTIMTSELSYTATALPDARYYWRVRGLNSLDIAGSWSASWYFTVDTTPPGVPVLTVPANATIGTVSQPSFTWRAVSGAAQYQIQLDTMNPPAATHTVNTARYVPSSPLLITTYYWRVRTIDRAGNASAWSETRSLTVNSANNIAPIRNRYVTHTPTLTWGGVSWAIEYEIQVDNNSNFSSPEYATTTNAATLSVTTANLPNGFYYWRVRAKQANGVWGRWSPADSFVVESP